MPLPILTTADDVRTLINYLKNKPTGATITEAKAAIGRTVLDGRKFTAYTLWNFISREGERIKLTQQGWEYARKPASEPEIFRRVIDSIPPYKSVLEWAHHQKMDSITNVDVAAHWHDHHKDALGTDSDVTIKDNAVCFFHVAEAAGLGKIIVGRRGQPTRLDLDREQLKQYIEAGPSTPPWTAKSDETIANTEIEESEEIPAQTKIQSLVALERVEGRAAARQSVEVRCFISHGSNMDLVEQVQTMLDVAEIKSEVAVKEESSAIPVPEKVFSAMRKCTAGIIVVSVDESRKDKDGKYTINENVLIEIGAAFVLYDKRVVLLWDKRLKVPSNLQGLYRCEFEGNELSWTAGMKLMKAMRGFKDSDSPPI